jgi:hypothetical protein
MEALKNSRAVKQDSKIGHLANIINVQTKGASFTLKTLQELKPKG